MKISRFCIFKKGEKNVAFVLDNKIYKIGDWVVMNHRYGGAVVRVGEILESGYIVEFANNKRRWAPCLDCVVSIASDEQIMDEMARRVLYVMKNAGER